MWQKDFRKLLPLELSPFPTLTLKFRPLLFGKLAKAASPATTGLLLLSLDEEPICGNVAKRFVVPTATPTPLSIRRAAGTTATRPSRATRSGESCTNFLADFFQSFDLFVGQFQLPTHFRDGEKPKSAGEASAKPTNEPPKTSKTASAGRTTPLPRLLSHGQHAQADQGDCHP